MVGSLCGTLARRAELTFEALAAEHRKGWPSSEVTHTEENLRAIDRAHGDRVAIRPFTSDEERSNGADWEWWFHSGGVGFGMRVQAKRANRNGGYDLRYRPDGDKYQNDLLIEDAMKAGCIPAYVFYNHLNWPQIRPGRPWVGCDHGPFSEGQLGCTIASALVVRQTLRGARVSTRYVKHRSRPWNRILCDGSEASAPSLEVAYGRVLSLHQTALAELEEKAELSKAPSEVATLPIGSARSNELGWVDRHQYDGDEDRRWAYRETTRSAAPLSPSERALREQLREMADRPVRRLPQRVRAMIRGAEGEPADERVAGAVLVNLGFIEP
ncbi:hypothetical protein JCM13580A_36140 [Streptomyces drozdowiczii]|uniref:DUF6615 family protein n=1 Tax=Streptomyces drozdowiczii TaxID=202862 RepID=UPI0031E91166